MWSKGDYLFRLYPFFLPIRTIHPSTDLTPNKPTANVVATLDHLADELLVSDLFPRRLRRPRVHSLPISLYPLHRSPMLNWFYQLVLSVITRILSWFGLSWGKDVQEALESAVEALDAAKLDEPQEQEQAVEAYSAESALAPVASVVSAITAPSNSE